MSTNIQKLIKQSKDPQFITEIFEFAKEAYGSAKRETGETFIEHVTSVALLLSKLGLDTKTIAAGILHDCANPAVTDAKEKSLSGIEKKFGTELAQVVEKVSRVHKIYYSFHLNHKDLLNTQKAEQIRKMFLAIAGDLRVVLIELAARIDGLQKIGRLSQAQQLLYATETLEIFVPIANRLGLGEIKRQMEDPAFSILMPEKFAWLQAHVKEKYEERQKYLKKFIPRFKKVVKHEKIPFLTIDYRAKSYWSTYQKLERHHMDFEKLHDLVAMRVIVKDIATCYKMLGVVHKYYQPISGQIQDYIAKPKENGYQSLHTTVFLPAFAKASADKEENVISEIQIKTEAMHKESEYGVCAHWAYKEKINLQKDSEKLQWSKNVPEFLKTFTIDFFADQVFAFTPKGDIISLPKGSTPVDFAYAVHSDIGNHCESARIDGKIVSLSQVLHNGDVVEIITNKKRNPSQDWLKFVKTNFAKVNIKKTTLIKIPSAIFSIPGFIKKKIVEISEKAKVRKTPKPLQIYLAGQTGIMVNIAKCCNPQPGNPAKAYLTRYRAAVLHKISCPNLQKLSQKFPEKIIDASWK